MVALRIDPSIRSDYNVAALMKYVWLDVDPVCLPSELPLGRSFTIFTLGP